MTTLCDVIDNCTECPRYGDDCDGERLYTHEEAWGMTDPISRANAIRWVKTECNTYGKPTLEFESGKRVIEHLKQMPSADSKTKWIPCSERLPKARESVILSTKEWTGEGCYWETTKHHVIWKGYRWDATYWDDEVIAWMPLPKPYKGGGDE